MPEMNTGIQNRVDQVSYVKIGGTYELLGYGFKELNEKPGAQSSDKKYINQRSKSSDITGYQWESGFSADIIKSEAVIKDFIDIGKYQKVGAEARRDYVMVELDEKQSGVENVFTARQITVTVEVSDFSDIDGEMGVEGTLKGVTDIVAGTFNTTTKTFTPDDGAIVVEP